MAGELEKPLPRNLFLAQQVDQESINEITKSIVEIRDHDEYLKKYYKLYNLNYEPDPILLHVDSYGGAVYQCFGLLAVMKAKGTPVDTLVTGCAMSCGFLIAIHGRHRMAYKHATLMYHQVSSNATGTAADMEEEVIEVRRLQDKIEDMTMECTKISSDKLKKIYKKKTDWYLDTKDALKWGCIDQVV